MKNIFKTALFAILSVFSILYLCNHLIILFFVIWLGLGAWHHYSILKCSHFIDTFTANMLIFVGYLLPPMAMAATEMTYCCSYINDIKNFFNYLCVKNSIEKIELCCPIVFHLKKNQKESHDPLNN